MAALGRKRPGDRMGATEGHSRINAPGSRGVAEVAVKAVRVRGDRPGGGVAVERLHVVEGADPGARPTR